MQIIPILIIQLYTNDVYVNELRGVSIFASVMGFILIFEIIGESILIYREIHNDIRDVLIRSEVRKRAKNYQKSCLCSFIGIVIFGIILSVTLLQI